MPTFHSTGHALVFQAQGTLQQISNTILTGNEEGDSGAAKSHPIITGNG